MTLSAESASAAPRPVRPGVLRRWSAEHPLLVDVVTSLVLVVMPAILFTLRPNHRGEKLPDLWVVGTVIATVLVMVRRVHPPVVLALATGAAGVLMVIAEARNVVFVAVVVCAFTVASRGNRRLAVAAGAGSAAALFVTSAVALPGGWSSGDNFAIVAWMGMAVAAGDAFRSRREYIAAVEERAVRAEHGREQEARRQVAEERLRIARELHDVVAHHMALITVQSGVAAHLLRSQPDEAERALAIVRESGRSVLQEMTGMLNVLRRPEDGEDPLEPLPTLHQLAELVDSFAAAGLHVEWRSIGSPPEMDTSVQLTVYRVVQESLTNARKYGDGSARLCVTYTTDAVGIDVENRVGREAMAGTESTARGGLGLIGMHERVDSLGGTISAGPRQPGLFCVSASIPVGGGHR